MQCTVIRYQLFINADLSCTNIRSNKVVFRQRHALLNTYSRTCSGLEYIEKRKVQIKHVLPEFLPFSPTFQCIPPTLQSRQIWKLTMLCEGDIHRYFQYCHMPYIQSVSQECPLYQFLPQVSIVYIIKQFESCFSNIMHTLGTHETFIKNNSILSPSPPPVHAIVPLFHLQQENQLSPCCCLSWVYATQNLSQWCCVRQQWSV